MNGRLGLAWLCFSGSRSHFYFPEEKSCKVWYVISEQWNGLVNFWPFWKYWHCCAWQNNRSRSSPRVFFCLAIMLSDLLMVNWLTKLSYIYLQLIVKDYLIHFTQFLWLCLVRFTQFSQSSYISCVIPTCFWLVCTKIDKIEAITSLLMNSHKEHSERLTNCLMYNRADVSWQRCRNTPYTNNN